MTATVPEGRIGWWGGADLRPRCPEHDKVAFDEEAAKRSAAKIQGRGTKMSAYHANCGYWHVGHDRRGR
jgi:hypothetical protein